jgi:hypothetical protein
MTFSFDAEVPPQSRTISIPIRYRITLSGIGSRLSEDNCLVLLSDPKFRPAVLTEAGHVREFADVYQLFEVCLDLLKDPTCGIGRRSRE